MEAAAPGQMRIGEALQDARREAGLDVHTVEERTKIRSKYLRALEGEDWEALPGTAYAKGFLRTYGELLGLDPESLVDEYRRQVEGGVGSPPRTRGAGDDKRRSRTPLIAGGVALAVLGALAVIGLSSGGQDQPKVADTARHGGGHAGGQAAGAGSAAGDAAGKVTLALVVHDPVEVCLVGGGGEALIDGQVLASGTREKFERHRFGLRFQSGFDPGEFRLEVAGEKRILPKVDGPAAFEITPPRHVRPVKPGGAGCP